MKKLKLFLAILLLGSGIASGVMFSTERGYPGFSLWNVEGQDSHESIIFQYGKTYYMYFLFSCPCDVKKLYVEIDVQVQGMLIPQLGKTRLVNVYRGSLPATKGDVIEIKLPFEAIIDTTPHTGDFIVKFTNEKGEPIAGGRASYFLFY